MRSLPISELCEVVGGGTPSRENSAFWTGEIPWVSPKDMKKWRISDTQEHISREALARSATKLVQPPAVLLVVRGMILRRTIPVALAESPVALNQDMKALVPNPGVDAEYLGFMLKAQEEALLRKVETAGHGTGRLATETWRSILVPVPELQEQQRIVGRIRELMDRVDEIRSLRITVASENNRVLSATVTELFAALRMRCHERSIGEIVGDRPGAMASGPFGSQLKHEEFVDQGHLVIGIANVQQDRFDPVRKWMVNDAILSRLQRYRVRPDDLLVTIMGTVGRTCVVPPEVGIAVTSKHVYRIRLPKDCVLPRFVSAAINFDRETVRRLHGRAIGGVMPGLNGTKLRELRVPVPPIDEQWRVVEFLDRVKAVSAVGHHAATQPEGLLPTAILRKAFAGEL